MPEGRAGLGSLSCCDCEEAQGIRPSTMTLNFAPVSVVILFIPLCAFPNSLLPLPTVNPHKKMDE